MDSRKPRHDWRAALTIDELPIVDRLDREMDRAEKELARIKALLTPIRNRAVRRVIKERDSARCYCPNCGMTLMPAARDDPEPS